MGDRLFFSSRGYSWFLKNVTRLFSWICLLGGLGIFAVSDTALAADQCRVEGQAKLPHAGRVKKKVQVMSFENTTAPYRGAVRSLSANTGGSFTTGASGGARQVRTRDTYEYVEMKPLVFLQLDGDYRHCIVAAAPKGKFKIEGLEPGTYKLTFAIPDLGYMEKEVKVTPEAAEEDGKLKIEFDFEAKGTTVEPTERDKISEKGADAFEKGSKEFNKGNEEKAFEEFEKAVKLDDHYAEAWEYMGVIQHTGENLEDAEKYFKKSLEIEPNSYRSLADLGTILLVKGDPAAARDLYEKALLIRPDDPQPRTLLGMALFQLQELRLASDQLVKARAIDPEHFSQPQLLSAEIFRLLGEIDNMKAELNSFLENFSDDPKYPAVKQALEGIGQ